MSGIGKLYIVATPIGNLADITHRAVAMLNDVDVIAAEDTRHSQTLLQHYGISTRMLSLHEHNETQRISQLIAKLQEGQSVALISDAGTPLISDPGYVLVNQCRQADIQVVPIPGPCAAVTALCAAGLPTDSFLFQGFLPVKKQAKQNQIEQLNQQTATSIFYEAPRRVMDSLQVMADALDDGRTVVIAKELTKSFETFFSGTAAQAVQWLQEDSNRQKGEFVLMVAGIDKQPSEIPAEAEVLLTRLMQELPVKKAAAITAEQYGLKKNSLYQLALTLQ